MHKKRVLLYTFNKIVNLLASEKRDPEVRGLSVIKIRKKVARDKLWEAQNGNSFICTAEGAFVNSSFRQNSYKNLVEAEKIVRECNEFEESVSCFDYNGDRASIRSDAATSISSRRSTLKRARFFSSPRRATTLFRFNSLSLKFIFLMILIYF